MSTIGYKDWAVDLADVSAIYPFQGSEVLMTVLCIAFWIGWHRIQFKRESEHLEKARRVGDKEKVARALERY